MNNPATIFDTPIELNTENEAAIVFTDDGDIFLPDALAIDGVVEHDYASLMDSREPLTRSWPDEEPTGWERCLATEVALYMTPRVCTNAADAEKPSTVDACLDLYEADLLFAERGAERYNHRSSAAGPFPVCR